MNHEIVSWRRDGGRDERPFDLAQGKLTAGKLPALRLMID
jgi:hypothetical protein